MDKWFHVVCRVCNIEKDLVPKDAINFDGFNKKQYKRAVLHGKKATCNSCVNKMNEKRVDVI